MVCSEAGLAANSKCPAENCRPPKLRVMAWTMPITPTREKDVSDTPMLSVNEKKNKGRSPG